MKYSSSKDGRSRKRTESGNLFLPKRVLRVYESRTTCCSCREKTKKIALTEEFVLLNNKKEG